MRAAALQTKLSHRSLGLLLALGLLIGLAGPAAAQSDDPPARVARVAEVIGEAWLFDTETKEWTRVTRNQTIAEGDRLRTDERSRISLRIGSTTVWLDERTDLAFDQLDEGQVLMQLDKGDVGLRLRAQDAAADFRIRTREGVMYTERDGLYRVEQLDRGSKAYVFVGRLRFESVRGGRDVAPVWLQNNQQAEFWWANGARAERQRLESDGFGDWLAAQNNRDSGVSVSQRYVSPEMTGAEELDRNGRWEQANEFGSVWIPYSVGAAWVPYRDGRWVWTRHWGWSWVDDQPWGFAPFHYGRWVQWGGRWCWAPGRYVSRPVYAPALVGWVGGPGLSIGINIGNQRNPPPRHGWYPLAPREAYVPGYRHSPTYGVRVNNGDHEHANGQRPHRNQNVVEAISYLPGQGGPARGIAPADGIGPVRPVFTPSAAPGRGELPQLRSQPQRPAGEVTGPTPAWRSENAGRQGWNRDRERERERDGQPQLQLQQQQQPPRGLTPPAAVITETRGESVRQLPQPPQVQQQQSPQPQLPMQVQQLQQPQQPQQVQAPQQPQRPGDQPWRGRDRDRDRDIEQSREREPVRAVPMPMPAAEQPRQVERPRAVEAPQARPQPAAPSPVVQLPPPPPQQRAEDRGPQRARQDGPVRDSRGRERNETER